VAAVLLLDGRDTLAGFVEGFTPGDLHEALVGATKRRRDAIRIGADVLDGRGLGTDVATAQRIVLVAAHRDDAVVFDFHHEAAAGLAEHAGMKVAGHQSLKV
jgi:hypothetical protein